MTRGPFDRSDTVKRRLAKGQQFNAYEVDEAGDPDGVGAGGCAVGIGPVGDFLQLATTGRTRTANMLVDALRAAAGQPPCTCPLEEVES